MSSDNGIYLHHFRNGWKVVHSQCIENAFESKKAMIDYFSDSPLFNTRKEAWKYAMKLYGKTIKDYEYVEYGIQEV